MNDIQILQEWECCVIEIEGNEISLLMHDLTEPSNPEEIAVIEIDKLKIDPAQLKLGTILFWRIVHEIDREPCSVFQLYDKVWTKEDIEIANQRAEKLVAFFREVL